MSTKANNHNIFKDLIELTKPRIVTLIAITGALGFTLGKHINWTGTSLWISILGISLSCAGSGVFNSYLERDVDGLMKRTANRPLPTKRISPTVALIWGISLATSGILLLAFKVNLLTSLISAITIALYVAVYTPLKRISWLNTPVGAIPGALPPLGGWTAATNDLSHHAWILFLILFVWQIPHFYSIAWMYKEDYQKGGFKMLPTANDGEKRTMWQVMMYTMLMFPVTALPFIAGLAGWFYLIGVFFLNIYLLKGSINFIKLRDHASARKLLKTTVFYLPIILLLIFIEGHLLAL